MTAKLQARLAMSILPNYALVQDDSKDGQMSNGQVAEWVCDLAAKTVEEFERRGWVDEEGENSE